MSLSHLEALSLCSVRDRYRSDISSILFLFLLLSQYVIMELGYRYRRGNDIISENENAPAGADADRSRGV